MVAQQLLKALINLLNFLIEKVKKLYQSQVKQEISLLDSRLWHVTLPNINGQSRRALVATLQMWWIKPSMNICASMKNSIYKKCTNLEKQILGSCSIPPKNEYERINTKSNYSFLKKNILNYNF